MCQHFKPPLRMATINEPIAEHNESNSLPEYPANKNCEYCVTWTTPLRICHYLCCLDFLSLSYVIIDGAAFVVRCFKSILEFDAILEYIDVTIAFLFFTGRKHSRQCMQIS